MKLLWSLLCSFSFSVGIIALIIFIAFSWLRNSEERWQMLLEKRKDSDNGTLRTMSEDQLRNLIQRTYKASLITFVVCSILFVLSIVEIFILN